MSWVTAKPTARLGAMMTTPEERFTELFSRTHLPLLAYAVRRVADPADAADVVAETFLVAWRRLDDVPAGDAARPWLFGVARRVLANHYRGEHRRHALADRLRAELATLAEPDPPATDPDEAPLVTRALQRLSDTDQELIRLVAWEQLSREQIAVAMGLSRPAIRVRLHRARARLAAAMRALEESDEVGLQRNSTTGQAWDSGAIGLRNPTDVKELS